MREHTNCPMLMMTWFSILASTIHWNYPRHASYAAIWWPISLNNMYMATIWPLMTGVGVSWERLYSHIFCILIHLSFAIDEATIIRVGLLEIQFCTKLGSWDNMICVHPLKSIFWNQVSMPLTRQSANLLDMPCSQLPGSCCHNPKEYKSSRSAVSGSWMFG